MKRGKFLNSLLLALCIFPYAQNLGSVVQVTAQTVQANDENKDSGSTEGNSSTENSSADATGNENTQLESAESNESTVTTDDTEVAAGVSIPDDATNTSTSNDETSENNNAATSDKSEDATADNAQKNTTIPVKESSKKSSKASDTCSTVDISTMDADLNSGEESQIRGEISVSPDYAADGLNPGDRWETITIHLSDNLKPSEPLSFSSNTILTPNSFAEAYDASTNTLTFNIADYYAANVGVVEQVTFYTEFIGASDLDTGLIDITATSANGEKCEKSVELTYHDPVKWNVDKNRVSPSGSFIAVGDEITYEVKASASGTANVTDPISLIDNLPPGVEVVDADGGTIDGDKITWDLTESEMQNHSASRTVTIKITDPDLYPVGTEFTNEGEVAVNDKVVDTDKVTDTISDSIVVDPGNVQKTAHAGETGHSGAIEPGGEIYWSFDGLDISGVGELDNYKVVDEFPSDVLHLDSIDFGSYKAPNQLVSVEVVYTDESGKEPLVINNPSEGGSYSLTGNQGDDVKEVVYSFNNVTLPFEVDSNKPGVHTTVLEELPVDPDTGEVISAIDNKAHFEYDITIPDGYSGEPGDLCPEPFSPVNAGEGKVTCTADGGDQIDVSETPATAGITKSITNTGPYYEGDTVDYRVSIHNNELSNRGITVTQLTDVLPSNEDYVPGSLVVKNHNGTTVNNEFVVDGDNLVLKFKPFMYIGKGETITFTYSTKVNDKASGTSNNKVYAHTAQEVTSNGDGYIVNEPSDFNGNGETDHVMFDNVSHEVNPVKVNIDKDIDGFNREFLPDTVVGTDGEAVSGANEVPYTITFTNDKDSGDITNPSFTDTLPSVVTYVDGSFSTTAPIPGNVSVSGNENDNGSSQKLVFSYDGTLHPGESITISFKAHVNDYAQYGRFTNNVTYNKDSDLIYDDASKFTDKVDATISGIAGQAINKKVDKTVIEQGEAVEYTVTVANTGTYNLGNLVLTDNIPRSDDGRYDPDTSTSATEVVDTRLIGLPTVYSGGKKVEGVTYEVTYVDNSGVSKTETVDGVRLEEIQVLYGADAIRKLKINLNSFVLHPGEKIQLKYEVETPNDAVNGAEFYNNAAIKSDVLDENGVKIKDINTTSSMTETIIDEKIPMTYKIGDFVWYDYDHDGKFNGKDTPVQGITIDLYSDDNYDGTFDEASAKLYSQSLTDENGRYLFPDLPQGDYKVVLTDGIMSNNFVETPKEGYLLSTQSKTDFPDTNSANIGKNYNLNADFALEPAVIHGKYFYDYNANGVMDSDEHVITDETPGVDDANLSLTLQRKINGSFVDVETTTTKNGAYAFNNLPAGTYRVKATYVGNGKPYMYTTSQKIDKTLEAGEVSEDNNFGLVEPADINGDIWEDDDMEKDYDESLMLAGVSVKLFKGTESTPVATTTTDGSGHYDFNMLLPGDYHVEFSKLDHTKYVNGGDSDFTDGKSETVTLKPKDEVIKNGGLYYLVNISGKYYEDMDYNLIQTSSDKKLQNYTIELRDSDNNVISTTKTDANGHYQFTDQEPFTDYVVHFTKDSDQEYIDGSKTFDTDMDTVGDVYINGTNLRPKDDVKDRNGSVVTKLTIKGTAFEDVDGDDQNASTAVDRTISDVAVNLLGSHNTNLNKTTDANGHYEFKDLYPGTYLVTINDVPSMIRVTQNTGAENVDSDVNNAGISDSLTLKSGDSESIVDAGYYEPVDISGIAYEDKNLNSKLDASENRLANVDADLWYKGSKIKTIKTNTNGGYIYRDLKPGSYQVKFTNNASLYPTDKGTPNLSGDSDIDKNEDTSLVQVNSGTNNYVSFDAGYYVPASIEGKVYYETDPKDLEASYDAADPLIKNITIELYDAQTNEKIATTVTDANGDYTFNNLKPGKYYVKSLGYPGAEFLQTVGGADGGMDNSGQSQTLDLSYGQEMIDVNSGLFSDKTQLGDFVFEDKNLNGIQDSGEKGIEGITVELRDTQNNLVQSTETNSTGQYIFNVEEPGNYVLKFEVPNGYMVTEKDATVDNLDSDVNSAGLTERINLESANFDEDMGLVKLSTVSGTVYRDKDENGDYTSDPDLEKAGQKVDLIASNGVVESTTTDANGKFEFKDVYPRAYTIRYNQVPVGKWTPETDGGLKLSADKLTASRDITVDYGEVVKDQDAGYENAGKISGYAYEDSDGLGTYEGLKDRMLSGVKVDLYEDNATTPLKSTTTDANGYYEFSVESADNNAYHVEFTKPSGFDGISVNKANSKAKDNDTNQAGSTAKKVVLDGTTNEVDYDGAFYQSISLGGNAYHDIDYDGKFTSGDTAYENLVVNLYDNGVKVSSTTTDVNGDYEFTNLKPGIYNVEFMLSTDETFSTLGTPNTELDNDTSTGNKTSASKLESGQTNYVSHDGAFVKLGEISGTIFYEKNPQLSKFAFYDLGEDIPLNSVKVDLYDDNGNLVKSTNTDTNGIYHFTNLKPGHYTVKSAQVPNAKYLTVLEGIQANRSTGNFELEYGGNVTKLDGGVFALSLLIGNLVWEDSNLNGIQDNGEKGIPGVTVNLYNQFNKKVASTTTDASGLYGFNVENPANYKVQVVKPNGYAYTKDTVGSDGTKDSDVLYTGYTAMTSVKADTLDLDAGLINLSSVSGIVYRDVNHNAKYDLGVDIPKADHVVDLSGTNFDGASTTTNKDGYYEFNDLMPQDYTIDVNNAPAGEWTKEADRGLILNSDGTAQRDVKIGYNQDLKDQNAGYGRKAIISGYAYDDYNADGKYDSSKDKFLPNVEVSLYQKGVAQAIDSKKTDADGYYEFNVDPADEKEYRVKFNLPSGFDSVSTKLANSKQYDNDIDQSLYTNYVNVKVDDNNQVDFDGAFYKKAQLSGYVYEDYNHNGKKEVTEKFIANQKVELLKAGVVVASTKTNAQGYYEFTNLEPNEYQVRVDVSDYHVSQLGTINTKYDNDINSGGLSSKVYLGSKDDNKVSYDGALYITREIGGIAYNDHNIDGKLGRQDELLKGLNVNLYLNGKKVDNTRTDANGIYKFTIDKRGEYQVEFENIGKNVSVLGTSATAKDNDTLADYRTSKVNLDLSRDDFEDFDGAFYNPINLGGTTYRDIDYNGQYTDGDELFPGVKVELYSNGLKVGETITDLDGKYEFKNIKPGTYHVKFSVSDGSVISVLGNPNTALDNDTQENFETSDIKLDNDYGDFVNNDGAFILEGSISGTIFYETNPILSKYAKYDELKDIPMDYIPINLYDASGTLVASTKTNLNGEYEFTNLKPGVYTVKAAPYPGLEYLIVNKGLDTSGTSNSINLKYDEDHKEVDGGLFAENLLIGNRVWEDSNMNGIQDPGEPGIAGITVNLYNNLGKVIASTETDSNGFYSFIVDKSGSYKVGIEQSKLKGYTYTSKDNGSNDRNDSDANLDGKTDLFALKTVNFDEDFGLVDLSSISGYVYRDVNHNGKYDLGTDLPEANHQVRLASSGRNVINTKTNADGYYEFKDLIKGNYQVLFDQAPSGSWTKEQDRGLLIKPDKTAIRDVKLAYNTDVTEQNAGYADQALIQGHTFNDYNADGIYDPSKDVVIPHVEVYLYEKGIKDPVAQTRTDNQGHYKFSVDPIDQKAYQVKFTMPDGFDKVSAKVADSKEYNNDIDDSLMTDFVNVKLHEENSVDFDGAFYKTASLSGYVYNDYEHDGKKASQEQAIGNQKVKLLVDGKQVANTVTDNNGYYEFTNLDPNNYQVLVDSENYYISPLGTVSTAYDNDIDQSGKTMSHYLGSLDNNSIDYDAALYQTALIGGLAYNDHNTNGKRDSKDEYLGGIKVNLLLDNKQVASTKTDANGAFQFEVDKNGNYRVEFENKEMKVSQLGTKNTLKDNDTNADYKTSAVTVKVGTNNFVDFDGAFNNSVPLTPLEPSKPIKPVKPIIPNKEVDTDGDGLSDKTEIDNGLNPYSKDTDGDGISDYEEFMNKKDKVIDKITNRVIVNTGSEYSMQAIIGLIFILTILFGVRRRQN